MINVVYVKTFGSTPVNSIAFRSDSIQHICIPIKGTCVGNVLIADEAETRLNTKIKTVIMYILYINVYLEPIVACYTRNVYHVMNFISIACTEIYR